MLKSFDMKIQNADFDISNGALVVKTPDPLTDEQRRYVKSHKPEILARLRFEKLAPTEDIDDLMDWYVDDYVLIAGLDDSQLGYMVLDYLNNRDSYKRRATWQQ